MKYNFQEIGERIRKLRKEKYKNQEDFGDALREMDVPISRNTISGIENGVEGKFSLDLLLACCKLFNCDIGYLLGEYGDCKTRDEQFILDETGLSAQSVERLLSKFSTPQNVFLDALISSKSFFEIDDLFYQYEAYIQRCNRHTAWFVENQNELKKLDSDSEEAALLRDKLGKGLITSGNMEMSIIALEYQISLCFSEILKEYRKGQLDILDQ